MELLFENSESKTGLHKIRTVILRFDEKGFSEVKEFVNYKQVKPTYKNGEAKIVTLPKKGFFIYIRLIRNYKGQVVGNIKVFNNDVEVVSCKYRKLKVIRVYGEKKYCEIVKSCLEFLKIPVKRFNVGK